MSVDELRALLERVRDTREIVLRATDTRRHGEGELLEVWRAAAGDAGEALRAWRRHPGRERYASYRAAADRADAAQAVLAVAQLGGPGVLAAS
jgi:hypothetical protein